MAITTTFFVVELVGAYVSNSLALLADAAHMLTDVAALGLALFAMWLATRVSSRADLRLSPRRDPGRARQCGQLDRPGHLHLLGGVAAAPGASGGGERSLLVVAVAGMLANIASAWVLSRGGGHRDNLNTRGAFLHVLGDLLGSAATIAAALIITFTGWYAADPILSVLIGGLVVFGHGRCCVSRWTFSWRPRRAAWWSPRCGGRWMPCRASQESTISTSGR